MFAFFYMVMVSYGVYAFNISSISGEVIAINTVLKFSFVLMAMFLAVSPVWGKDSENEKIQFGFYKFAEIEEVKRGFSNQLLMEMQYRLSQRGFELDISYLPIKRARRYFKDMKLDCLYPSLIRNLSVQQLNELGFTEGVFFSRPVSRLSPAYVITTRIDTPKLNSIDDLIEKKVGVLRGLFAYDSEVMKKIVNKEEVADGSQNMKKLSLKRLDAVLSLKVNVNRDIRVAGVTNLHNGEPFGQHDLGVAVLPTPKGMRFVHVFNTIVDEMMKDGSYCRILNNTVDVKMSLVDCSRNPSE